MAADLRNIGGRERYCDTYRLYPSDAIERGAAIKKGASALCRFHSRDVEEFHYEMVDNGYTSPMQYKGRIETIDDLSMARPDMYCVDEDSGETYIIEAPLVTANDAGATSVSRRPNKKYIMTLRRMEDESPSD